MKKPLTKLTFLCSVLFVSHVNGALYSMDFSVPGQGSTHDSGSDVIEASPISGVNWTLTFGNVSTDGTTNEFITVSGGLMRVQDWGGAGKVTSDAIHILENGTVDITGEGLSIGSDAFNAVGTEGITWFYAINGGTPVEHYLGENELGGPVASGTDVGYSFQNISVTSGDSLVIGFEVNVNGAGGGVEISSYDVNFSAVPEPTSFVFLGLAGLVMMARRKR